MPYPLQQQGVIQRSFAAGELTPAAYARADQVKYATGLRTCRNFIVQRAGGVANRPGLRYIATAKSNSLTVQILPYISEIAGESLLLEAGVGYIRFFKNGAAVGVSGVAAWSNVVDYVWGDVVSSGGVNYWAIIPSLAQAPPNATFWYPMPGTLLEIAHPFGADLFAWSQSGRTLTLTHEDHAPMELTYVGLTTWTLMPIVTVPGVLPPAGVALTPGAAGTLRAAYVVTAAAPGSYEESEASGQVINGATAAPTVAAPNVVSWTPDAVTPEFYIYSDPYFNGTYGFIGTATGVGVAAFHDTGITPDFTMTPPIPQPRFAVANDYPKVSGSYQQRRFFGYTNTHPDEIDASRVGFSSNFGISSPLQADDALKFRLAGNRHNPVRHLIGLKRQLVVLTDAGEWNVVGGQDGALTPNAINAEQETYCGVAPTRPVVVGNSILYVQARGSILRNLQFDLAIDGLGGRDLTIYSSHLVDGHQLEMLDYAQTPDSIVWCIREDGFLLGLTYMVDAQDAWGRNQYDGGWHRHDTFQSDGTQGLFVAVCVVPEGADDAAYFLVRRWIGGAWVVYLERMVRRKILTFNTDAFFLDAGLSYHGAPVNNIAGLGHLNGQVVAVVGDGAVIFDGNPAAANAADFTVTGGTLPVSLPATYSDIHAGLRFYSDLETLDLDVSSAEVRDKQKRISYLNVLLDASSRSLWAGPDTAHLKRYEAPPASLPGQAFEGQIELSLTSQFDGKGRVFIRQTDPLPLTILGVIPNIELGG